MQVKPTLRFGLAVALQVAVLFGLILVNLVPVNRSELVTLRVMPVDPTDPLRGDYMTISYEINRIDGYLVQDFPVIVGDRVYVQLSKRGQFYEPVGVYKTRPNNSAPVIAGTVQSGQIYGLNDTYNREVRVNYGIEQYFIPEGVGRGVIIRPENTQVVVAVTPEGTPAIRDVVVNGKSMAK